MARQGPWGRCKCSAREHRSCHDEPICHGIKETRRSATGSRSFGVPLENR